MEIWVMTTVVQEGPDVVGVESETFTSEEEAFKFAKRHSRHIWHMEKTVLDDKVGK